MTGDALPATVRWLTRAQVADRTGFSMKTLANWAAMNPPKGPRFIRVAGRARYLFADVDAWQAQFEKAAA